jgi:hypothetical protein
MKAQNGYDGVNSGESLTFEVTASDAGTNILLVCTLYGGVAAVPVRFKDATNNPSIKNGYDYTVELNFIGGDVLEGTSYEAILVEGEKRDVSNLISSL